jgi:hypothetical protein
MPDSLERALLTLIYKKGDERLLKNWRPISLLNVDYKIGSKALASRLKKVLGKIIHPGQTCGVKGRHMHQNLWTIDGLLEYINRQENRRSDNLLLMAIDQEKAFDRVEHDYMNKVLTSYGLGKKFIRWVKTLYNNPVCRANVNGNLTETIEIQRGIRQGCPLSMLLFVIIINPLLEQISKSKDINGFNLPNGNPIKVLAYADDITLILTNKQEIEEVYKIYEEYGKASGGKLNKEKTEIIAYGLIREKIQKQYKDQFVNHIKILGIKFGAKKDMARLNYEPIMEKIAKKMDVWKTRNLTLYGKILLICSSGMSQLWHIARVISPNEKQIKQLEQKIFKFLWYPKKYEPIARKTLQLRYEQGGMRLFNIRTRLKSYQVSRFKEILGENQDWHSLLSYFHGKELENTLPGLLAKSNTHSTTTSVANRAVNKIVKSIDWDVHDKIKHINKKIDDNITKHQPKVELANPEKEWKNIWISIQNENIKNKIKQTNYIIAHRALPTQDVIENKFGWESKITQCVFKCGNKETLNHIMKECPMTQSILEQIYHEHIGHEQWTNKNEHLDFQLDDMKTRNWISCFRHQVWRFRNKIGIFGEKLTTDDLKYKIEKTFNNNRNVFANK